MENIAEVNSELESANEELRISEEYQDFVIKILDTLNSPSAKMDVICSILKLVKDFTGLDAVGIRLKDGDDYPYYETIGFEEEFVVKEQFLCSRHPGGEIVLDDSGLAVLDCMCGNVIRGRTDDRHPFFTKGGSFWTNDTTDLLASTTEEERKSRTRNKCNGEGYESVALIPLRSNREIIGLLQMNAKRKGMFTKRMINFFEGIGASIGIAVARKNTEERMSASLKEKETLLREIHHRVKNNLQVISSLLYLQSEHETDERILSSLTASQNRIRSMALVHEKLYRSSDLNEVDINDFIVSMINELSYSFALCERIDFDIRVVDIYIDIDTAIPCALIINELITNAIKHAFPGERRGNIAIELQRDDEGIFTLTVSDNGVGIQ